MDEIPFFTFGQAPNGLKRSWAKAIRTTIKSGIFINGPEVTSFENKFAQEINSNFAIGTSNGFDGLVVALQALEIGAGSRVAVPAHTFIATWTAVLAAGATPVGVDVDENGLLDLQAFRCVAPKVDAVIPVHLHGAMVNMQQTQEIAKEFGIKVIEDASQAHLAKNAGGYAGTQSDVGVFSLYPTKNLGALGDAGIITTQNPELDSKIRSLINYGSAVNNKYEYERIGSNKRLDEIQASVLLINLDQVEKWNNRRIELAKIYFEQLQGLPIEFMHEDVYSIFHHFCIQLESRDLIRLKLKEAGVGTEVHYPRTAAHQISKLIGVNKGEFPNAEKISARILSLPISPWHTRKQIYKVTEIIKNIL
jgi:dTDP-3-amino-3,4,6-trideoxy-alpha-D-glucose transaminase